MVRINDNCVEEPLDAYLLEQASKLILSILIVWYNIKWCDLQACFQLGWWHALGGYSIKWKVGAMWLIGSYTYFHATKE